MIIRSPTGSYLIALPDAAEQDIDDDVVSYRIAGDDLLLQLSSRSRNDGPYASASDLMRRRLDWGYSDVTPVMLDIGACHDVAAASVDEGDGACWLFVYAVWPSLAVFVTVTHPTRDVAEESWALEAIRSIRLVGYDVD